MNDPDRKTGVDTGRREVLALLGAAGAALLAGRSNAQRDSASAAHAPPPACIVTPEQTEGPYFVDQRLKRSDIRGDPSDGSIRAGIALTLALRVSAIGKAGCTPLAGAAVDVWHCDAAGVYSDATDAGFRTVGTKFLRGYQETDANAGVQFTTIYPGWYPGRAVHIHFKVRAADKPGRVHEFTSQLYFDESISDQVFTQQPYASRGQRRLKNDGDGLFRDGGRHTLLTPVKGAQGYAAKFDVGLKIG